MKIISMKCPHCQGTLDIKKEQRGGFTTCPFCGTKFFLEEEQPNINQTINIKEVHIGNTGRTAGEPKSAKPSPAFFGMAIFISVIAVLSLFLPTVFRKFAQNDIGGAESIIPASYRTAPESGAVKSFAENIFGKSVTEIKENEYASIKYLKVQKETTGSFTSDSSSNPWLFTYSKEVDEYGKAINPETIKINIKDEITEEDFQVFTGLETLDLSNESNIKPSIKYESADFRNLKNLHYYTGTAGEFLTSLPMFYDVQNIYGLGTVYLSNEEYLTELKKFSKLKTFSPSSINKDFTADLTFLSSFPDLEELKLNFSSGATWDLAGLSALTKLSKLEINGFDTKFEHLNVLSGMPQLTNIKFDNMKDLKNLDFVKNMPNLKTLHVEDCPIINLNGLKDSLSLTELTLDGCGDLADVSTLSSLTSLKKLNIAYIWNFDVKFPKLNKLTALSDVYIEASHLDIIADMPSIKKLTIYETSMEYSFKPLAGMKSLSELEVRNYNHANKPDMAAYLAKLPKLKSLTFSYGSLADGIDYSSVFSLPQVTKLRIKPIDTGSSYISVSISSLKNNKVLKELDTGGVSIDNLDIRYGSAVNFGEYANEFLSHFPKLKKLNVSSSHIQDLDFVSKMPLLEELDISGNYITDISKLLKLKKLKALNCDKDQISNLDLLPESVKIIE